jgi:hypothetical protein
LSICAEPGSNAFDLDASALSLKSNGLNPRRLAVATQRWILSLLPAAMIVMLAGCGGSTFNVQNPPPPPPPNLTIAFQPVPSGAVTVGSTTNLTAVVGNDTTNAGVDWTLTCQSGVGTCGAIGPLHTASGSPTTYTPPAALSGNSLTGISVVAFATADHTKNVVAPFTVTAFGSSLQGSYVLQVLGVNNGLNYQFAGVVILDGNGGISSCEQSVNFFDQTTGALMTKSDTILTNAGSYFLGNDGRGTITINTGDTDIGGNGIETFAFVYLTNSKSLISQLDLGSAQTGSSAVGTMDLQTSTTPPLGGYAFVMSGLDIPKVAPLAFGGVFNIDSPNALSGTGGVTDEILAKKLTPTLAGVSGTLTNPDSFGAVTFDLSADFGPGSKPIPIQFTGYIVDGSHIKLIESDSSAGAGFGLTAGLAIGQGTAAGTFRNSSLSGNFVFGVPGTDLSNANIAPTTLTSVGVFTSDGGGNLTNGFTDTFLQVSTIQPPNHAGGQISTSFDGTYSVDPSGTGRASLVINLNPAPKPTFQPTILFYLTGNGNPPLVLEAGDSHYPSLGAGIAYSQSTGPLTISGDYGLNFAQQNGSENDGTAQLNASATTVPPSISGIADINLGSGANVDQLFTGSFAVPGSNGISSGTLVGTNNDIISSAVFNPLINVNFYVIDPSHGFFVETDLITAGAQQNGQVSLGYYAARSPLCDGCP